MFIICTMNEDSIRTKSERIEEYICKIAEGDREALGSLYELISTDVYAYALSKCGRAEDAEDIMHDTFVQIFRYAKQYRPMGKPLAWIFTIELNLFRRMRTVDSRVVELDDTIEVADEGSSFEDKVITNEYLLSLLMTLDEDEREIISLYIVSGLKHREIADLLKKPLSTVLSRYNRAIKKLRILVREEDM